MRAVVGIGVLLLVLVLAGCGGGSSSSSGSTSDGSEVPASNQPQETPIEREQQEPATTGAEAAEDETDSSVSDSGSYNGTNLCDLGQIEEEVRAVYEVDPSTEVICQPAKSQPNVVAAWNWWVVQPEQHSRVPLPPSEEKALHELTGEKATNYRVEVGIAEGHDGKLWNKERRDADRPSNDLQLTEVNGREAIWGANYLLLTPISEDQVLAIAVLAGETEAGPVVGEPTAISIAEEVERAAF